LGSRCGLTARIADLSIRADRGIERGPCFLVLVQERFGGAQGTLSIRCEPRGIALLRQL
jgi:hypothetical protein